MTYDRWKATDPREDLPDEPTCERCNARETVSENEYGEFICAECVDNAAERAWDRHQEYLMENGPGPTLAEQQAEARKLK